jgi:hypothetical protein
LVNSTPPILDRFFLNNNSKKRKEGRSFFPFAHVFLLLFFPLPLAHFKTCEGRREKEREVNVGKGEDFLSKWEI